MTRLLPDGSIVPSDEEYLDAWREFARPLCEAIGLEIYGFDPDVAFYASDNPRLRIDLPRWFIARINKVLEKED